ASIFHGDRRAYTSQELPGDDYRQSHREICYSAGGLVIHLSRVGKILPRCLPHGMVETHYQGVGPSPVVPVHIDRPIHFSSPVCEVLPGVYSERTNLDPLRMVRRRVRYADVRSIALDASCGNRHVIPADLCGLSLTGCNAPCRASKDTSLE